MELEKAGKSELLELVRDISDMVDAIASSIIYCIVGLSTIGNISFGCAFVAGKNLVPNPAAGIIAFLTFIILPLPSFTYNYILSYLNNYVNKI